MPERREVVDWGGGTCRSLTGTISSFLFEKNSYIPPLYCVSFFFFFFFSRFNHLPLRVPGYEHIGARSGTQALFFFTFFSFYISPRIDPLFPTQSAINRDARTRKERSFWNVERDELQLHHSDRCILCYNSNICSWYVYHGSRAILSFLSFVLFEFLFFRR